MFLQLDQMQLDLGNERALSNKAESARTQLEKQNKELKLRVSELEEFSRKGNKNQVSALESKVTTTRLTRGLCVDRYIEESGSRSNLLLLLLLYHLTV